MLRDVKISHAVDILNKHSWNLQVKLALTCSKMFPTKCASMTMFIYQTTLINATGSTISACGEIQLEFSVTVSPICSQNLETKIFNI